MFVYAYLALVIFSLISYIAAIVRGKTEGHPLVLLLCFAPCANLVILGASLYLLLSKDEG